MKLPKFTAENALRAAVSAVYTYRVASNFLSRFDNNIHLAELCDAWIYGYPTCGGKLLYCDKYKGPKFGDYVYCGKTKMDCSSVWNC